MRPYFHCPFGRAGSSPASGTVHNTTNGEKTMLKWKKVADGCYHGYKPGALNPIAVVEKPYWAHTLRKALWNVTIFGRGHITHQGCDCFAFRYAKRLANKVAFDLDIEIFD